MLVGGPRILARSGMWPTPNIRASEPSTSHPGYCFSRAVASGSLIISNQTAIWFRASMAVCTKAGTAQPTTHPSHSVQRSTPTANHIRHSASAAETAQATATQPGPVTCTQSQEQLQERRGPHMYCPRLVSAKEVDVELMQVPRADLGACAGLCSRRACAGHAVFLTLLIPFPS